MDDGTIIDNLGGTNATARLCDCTKSAVSQWRINGIPKARRMFLQLVRPDAFLPPIEKRVRDRRAA